uniref:hypothetical protein n=1 Tax=Streptomyces sp. NBC_01401 TaxID=2903854 RepID=UPI002F912208
MQLPVEPGKVSLPIFYGDIFGANETAKGTFQLSVEAYNHDDADLACVRAQVDLRST